MDVGGIALDGLDIRIYPLARGVGFVRPRSAFCGPFSLHADGVPFGAANCLRNFNVLSLYFDASGVTRPVIVPGHDPSLDHF